MEKFMIQHYSLIRKTSKKVVNRNSWLAWYMLGRKKTKYQCIPSFPLKAICTYFMDQKISDNFGSLLRLHCFKMRLFFRVDRR